MREIAKRAALCLPLLGTACSIRPSPQDYAHVAAPDIVKQVRCEARAAIADNLGQWLEAKKQVALAAQFPNDPTKPMHLDDAMFHDDILEVVKIFEDTGIAYDFTLDMTEVNNLDSMFDVLGILRHTTLSAGLSAGLDRTRENVTSFTITDNFKDLINMKDPEGYCKAYVAVGNYMYPITGKIGLGGIIHSFIDLNLFSNLSGPAQKGTPASVTALSFTTKLSGSLAPKVLLGLAARGAQIVDASVTAVLSRTDYHKLIISLAMPEKPKVAAANTTANFITVNASTGAEVIAAEKLNQYIFRFELGRAGAYVPISQ